MLERPGVAAQIEPAALEIMQDAERKRYQKARNEAGHEHLGNAHLAGNAIDNHRDAWRNDDADAARRGSRGGGISRVVAALGHGRNHEHAHSRSGGRARAGNCAEKNAGKHCGYGKAARNWPHKGLGHGHQPARNARSLHERTRQHKGRQCHERKGRKRGKGPLDHQGEVNVKNEEADHGAHAKSNHDGRAYEQENEEYGEEQGTDAHGGERFHQAAPPSLASSSKAVWLCFTAS